MGRHILIILVFSPDININLVYIDLNEFQVLDD